MEPEIVFIASSGNVARTQTFTRGDRVHVSVTWQDKASQQDLDEFNMAYKATHPDDRVESGPLGTKADALRQRERFFGADKN